MFFSLRSVYDRPPGGEVMPNFLDRILALCALITLSPLVLFAFVGTKISSPGPFLYSAERIGLNGKPFKMLKIRTMHMQKTSEMRQKITSANDSRIFHFGKFLRFTKIDELPQLLNILKGDMAIIGPRPEDADIVRLHYKPWHRETLTVRPGLSSPGSLFNYTHFDRYVGEEEPEEDYINHFLDRKLALDAVYARNKSFTYDLKIMLRTIRYILIMALGKKIADNPAEAAAAESSFNISYK